MSRKWKPGDVALREGRFDTQVAVVSTCRDHVDGAPHWHNQEGGFDYLITTSGTTYRPLVLIDPEDREQVERLATALVGPIFLKMWGRGMARQAAIESEINEVQAALRSLIEPPKPDEPTAYLAAVADIEGNRWHISEGPVDGDRRWYSPDLNVTRAYRNIAAVKVLSEGVQS